MTALTKAVLQYMKDPLKGTFVLEFLSNLPCNPLKIQDHFYANAGYAPTEEFSLHQPNSSIRSNSAFE